MKFLVFCLYVLGQSRTFLCPECRTETKIPDRGVEAFKDNTYAEEMIRMAKITQIGAICQVHKSHLVLFCNEEGCQKQICSACVLVDHKGHQIINLKNKADEVREQMSERKEKARDISLVFGNYLTELNAVEQKVNRDTSENLDKVDEAREVLHKRIQDLHQKVQEETETYKMELIQVQNRNMEQLKNMKDKVQQRKAQLDSFYVDVEKSMNSLSDNDFVQKGIKRDQVFEDLSNEELITKNFNVVIQEPKYKQPDLPTQLEMLRTGSIHQVETTVEAPCRQIVRITGMLPKLNEVKHINHEHLQSVKTFLFPLCEICLSENGSIVMSGKKPNAENCWLKCIRNGVNIWEVNTGQNVSVYGLCCVNRKKEYLINTLGRRLEVRDVTDGRLLHGCDVDFHPVQMCSTDDGSVLVVSNNITPRTLVKFKIIVQEGVTLQKTNETFNTEMNSVNGLTMLSYDEKKLVILTRCDANMIQAINYQTGTTEWKMLREEIDGKIIQPLGVCHDDVGHLFIADYQNNRVLVVSADDKIKQKLLDLPGDAYYIRFDVTQQKLIVDYYKNNENVLNIYDIEYITE